MNNKDLGCITEMHWSCKTWRATGFQSYPCKTKSAQQTQKSQTLLTSSRKPKIHVYGNSSDWSLLKLAKSCIAIMIDQHRTDPKRKEFCRTSCTTSERRHFISIGSVWTSGILLGRDNGVLLLTSKCARPTSRWPHTLCTSVQLTI